MPWRRLRALCKWLAIAYVALAARLPAGEWVGRTEERLDDPAAGGLSKPRVTTMRYPRIWQLDADRDGDVDTVRALRTDSRTTLQLELRAPDGRLVPAWSRALEPYGAADVTDVVAAHVTADRQCALIVQLARAPYLLAFHAATTRGAPTPPVPLDRRFPNRPSAAGAPVEPYLRLAAITDWDGDGLDDLVVRVCAAVEHRGFKERTQRHTLHVLRGGPAFEMPAEEALDLLKLGARSQLCAVGDLDADGAPEMLVEVERSRGGGITAGELVFIRKYGASLRQEAAWPLTARNLANVHFDDLNGDKIPDCVLADLASRELLFLRSRRGGGRGFTFELQTVALPKSTIAGAPDAVACFAADLNADGVTDFFTVATDHNQLARLLFAPDGTCTVTLEYLPSLPTAPPAAGENWHAKAIWYGDVDGDGASELLVMTNEVRDPDFLPPENEEARRDKLVQSIVVAGGERRHYAPYFRLMVVRVDALAVRCAAVFNTQLGAQGYEPAEIFIDANAADASRELVLEALPRGGGRPSQAVFKITGRLPGGPAQAQSAAGKVPPTP